MEKVYQIAIDGPAGSGKSSIAKLVAKKLGFQFINTGGMFRCYAIALKDCDLSNEQAIKEILNKSHVKLEGPKLFLNDQDVTDLANSAPVSLYASKIATIKTVREKCLVEQREIASKQSCVMEGRDTTSVVLPNATLRIFLDASVDVRARRR
ncbi:MAG: (d)CMP kinase [Mycoplasmoidaceae bacterium]|nr:(d)CMP kinase [Mycoplasmoidaceae bacterium]